MISDEEAISSPPGSIFAEIRCCPDNERKLIACSGLLLGLAVSEEDEKVMCRFCPQHGTKVYSCIIFRCWSTRKQACVYRIFIAIVYHSDYYIDAILRKNTRKTTSFCSYTLLYARSYTHTQSTHEMNYGCALLIYYMWIYKLCAAAAIHSFQTTVLYERHFPQAW